VNEFDNDANTGWIIKKRTKLCNDVVLLNVNRLEFERKERTLLQNNHN